MRSKCGKAPSGKANMLMVLQDLVQDPLNIGLILYQMPGHTKLHAIWIPISDLIEMIVVYVSTHILSNGNYPIHGSSL
jgi:hypothetical protein